MGYLKEVYAGRPETAIYNSPTGRKRKVNTILMGTWLGVTEVRDDGWYKVKTIGPDGWVRIGDTREDMGLKLFFIDVGQGDACLVEAPGKRVLIDGGPSSNTKAYLAGWKYKWMLKSARVKIDAIFVTHFDSDHYAGLTKIIDDSRFEFDTIYHNGIARFHSRKAKRPHGYNTDLGEKLDVGHSGDLLLTTFDSVSDARALLADGGLQSTFRKFLEAVIKADDEGRLGKLKHLNIEAGDLPGFADTDAFRIEVLGPVPASHQGKICYPWMDDSSHTRNGHSLVLKLHYGQRSILLGGDLNSHSERYLLSHYAPGNPFVSDVTKGCHHGSSDFSIEFLKAVQPYATVISSGDNENYSHPRADAIGCAGRYSRGERPMVFSTELARSFRTSEDIHYGLINLRCDGNQVVVAQMTEKKRPADLWDAYTLP